ncbi:DNA-directed RNA polymerase protein [Dioscorea alata]|uniref:DNA-directed RNA polymerase protein n=2 Tax=Dioscorea alata TaxID=55571 RepID=A0ACB7WUW5_DIOAL|nr:DNA-directed RNA polymerase protein [Dioscorea alata]KAH7692120.1 DNA-directed RNA polymerase protein [Dioscorea alata]
MSGEEEENAAELKIGDEFLKAKCLMNCEVALILDRRYEQLQQMSDDPTNQISQVFEKSMQYVKRFSRYKNPDAVRQVREYPCLRYYISSGFFTFVFWSFSLNC